MSLNQLRSLVKDARSSSATAPIFAELATLIRTSNQSVNLLSRIPPNVKRPDSLLPNLTKIIEGASSLAPTQFPVHDNLLSSTNGVYGETPPVSLFQLLSLLPLPEKSSSSSSSFLDVGSGSGATSREKAKRRVAENEG